MINKDFGSRVCIKIWISWNTQRIRRFLSPCGCNNLYIIWRYYLLQVHLILWLSASSGGIFFLAGSRVPCSSLFVRLAESSPLHGFDIDGHMERSYFIQVLELMQMHPKERLRRVILTASWFIAINVGQFVPENSLRFPWHILIFSWRDLVDLVDL